MKPQRKIQKRKADRGIAGRSEGVYLITTASMEEAQKIAGSLVGEHLMACVNIVPQVQSIFFWQGRVCNESEVLLIGKGRLSQFGKVMDRVKALHSYQVPEVIALPIVRGSPDYLGWLREVTS